MLFRPEGLGKLGVFVITKCCIEIEDESGLAKATSALLHRTSHA